MANHFFDKIERTIIADAPPEADVDLAGDGDRANVGLALLMVSVGFVVAVVSWAAVIWWIV